MELKCLNWHFLMQLLILMTLVIKENSCIPAARSRTSRRIVFPEENFDDCFLDEANKQQPGVCKLLDDCTEILKKWQAENTYPKTCYFLKQDQFVCCPNKPDSSPSSTTTTTTTSSTTTSTSTSTSTTEEVPATTSGFPIEQETSTKSFLDLLLEDQRPSEIECDLNQQVHIEVVNGIPTDVDEFPFMAALGWTSNTDDTVLYRCGGAVISSKFILTAAHCAEIGGEFASVARIGGSNLTDPSVANVKIKRFISHPDYNSTTTLHDIALVELEEPLKLFSVCCLWTNLELPSLNVTALGYGHVRFGGIASEQLLKAPLKVVTQQNCDKYFRTTEEGGVASDIVINDSHLCANDPDELRDTCQGDSGGPLVIETGVSPYRRYNLVGITSYGLGCAGVPPSIYTRVSSYIDWIESIVWTKSDLQNLVGF